MSGWSRRFTIILALLVALAPGQGRAGPLLLFDPANGKVLYAENADQPWYPASLTKLMTTYLAFEALKAGKLTWETKLVTSEHAHAQPPSKIGLPVGGELPLDTGLRAVIIKSANDVSVMVGEAIAGSEEAFVVLMNAKAKQLGMSRTTFANANGLPDPRQVTTARDMALLTRALLRDFPEHRGMFAEERMQVGAVRLRSHNTLLTSFEGADGMKTGFICAAGFNVVASATRGGRQLVAVVLGEVSGRARADRAAALLEHGFENYEWKLHFSAPAIETMAFAPVEAGEAQDLRTQLRSFECGGGARVAARKARRARALAKAKASRARKVAVAPDGSKATQGSDGQVVIQNPPSAAAAATVVTGAADRNKPHAAPKLPSANAASQDPSKAR